MVSENRDEFIKNNIALVHSVSKRFKGRAEYDDIFQAGCVGLIKAVDNFDESRGFQFSTYAVPVIMGEIRRIFRDGGSIKISRAIKEKSVSVQRERERFINAQKREPLLSELSMITGYDSEELSEILNIINPVISLSVGEEGEKQLDIPVDESDRMLDRVAVRCAVSALAPKEQMLIKCRFFEGKTQSETALRLGISQVQVSRREKALIQKLRNVLE